MSSRPERKIDPKRQKSAEIKEGKRMVRQIYFEWKASILRAGGDLTNEELVQSILAMCKKIRLDVPWEVVRVPYLRAIELGLLARIGVKLVFQDEVLDKGFVPPTEESMRQAFKELGLQMPDPAPDSGSTGTAAVTDSDASNGTPGSGSGPAPSHKRPSRIPRPDVLPDTPDISYPPGETPASDA